MKYDPLRHTSLSPDQLEDLLENEEQQRRRPRKMRPEKKRPPAEGIRRHQPRALPPTEDS